MPYDFIKGFRAKRWSNLLHAQYKSLATLSPVKAKAYPVPTDDLLAGLCFSAMVEGMFPPTPPSNRLPWPGGKKLLWLSKLKKKEDWRKNSENAQCVRRETQLHTTSHTSLARSSYLIKTFPSSFLSPRSVSRDIQPFSGVTYFLDCSLEKRQEKSFFFSRRNMSCSQCLRTIWKMSRRLYCLWKVRKRALNIFRQSTAKVLMHKLQWSRE